MASPDLDLAPLNWPSGHHCLAIILAAARTEGMITDPVDEGKSVQGFIDPTRKNSFRKGSRVLFAQLRGVSALSGKSYYYKDG